MGFPGASAGKESACSAGDPDLIPGLGRSPGGGNGSPLQYSCWENPTDRGAWPATVHGVTRIGHDLATKPPPRIYTCMHRNGEGYWPVSHTEEPWIIYRTLLPRGEGMKLSLWALAPQRDTSPESTAQKAGRGCSHGWETWPTPPQPRGRASCQQWRASLIAGTLGVMCQKRHLTLVVSSSPNT